MNSAGRDILLRLPFICYTLAHLYLAIKQLAWTVEAPPVVWLATLLVTIGCAIDNFRLSLGITSLGKNLTYVSYFLHLTAVPILILSVMVVVQDFTSNTVISLFTRRALMVTAMLTTVALTLDGFHIFYHHVYQRVVLKPTPSKGVHQFGLVQTPQRFLLGVIVLSGTLLLSGCVWWRQTGDYNHFLVQALCFVAQAITPALVSKAYLMQVMNSFEVVVIADLLTVIAAVY